MIIDTSTIGKWVREHFKIVFTIALYVASYFSALFWNHSTEALAVFYFGTSILSFVLASRGLIQFLNKVFEWRWE